MEFVSLPIPDRQVPDSEAEITAACLLVTKGWNPEAAVQTLSVARGALVPETAEQRRWINRYAAILSAAK